MPVPYTIYAYNTNTVKIGTSTINDLVSTKTTNPYYTSASDVMSASGYTFFNKYTVENDTITEGYSCQNFSFINEPVCLQGGNASYYGTSTTGNRGIIEGLASTFRSNGGSCLAVDSDGACSAGNLGVDAYSEGRVNAYQYSTFKFCSVNLNGNASCT